ncbi:MAG: cytochrome b/b6 domain-containing protein [Bacteroidia bacterium]|nr:cytochrome b/b6 domain-containing protein [Bacteroidia bacterium]
MSGKVYLYPIWIRLWHITNALLCLILIISGISMHYASPDATRIRFDLAVSMHNISGVLLSLSYVIFFLGNLFTGNGLNYVIQFRGFRRRLWKQMYYYTIGFFKKEEPPFPIGSARKFNPLQQVTYAAVMYFFLPVSVVTGWGLLFPGIVIEEWLGLNGFAVTDFLHILGGFAVSMFLLIHLYFATMGKKPTDHYKAMLTGYHEDESEHEQMP